MKPRGRARFATILSWGAHDTTAGAVSIARLSRTTSLGTRTQGVLTAAALVSASLILSRLLGLARVAVFAGVYGTGSAFKEYNAAFRIPDILFTIVAGGALASAFVPVFAGLLEQRDEDEAWAVANTVLNTVLMVMVALALVAFAIAPELSHLLNPGFTTDQVNQTANLTRIMMAQPVLLGVGGIFAAMQNSYQRFLLPAVAPLMYNLSIVVGAAIFGAHYGVYAAAWAVVAGAFLMFEIQIWGVAPESWRYRIGLNWRIAGARDVLRLTGPRVLALASFQLMLLVTFWLASSLTATRNTAITYAWTLVMFPVGAFGTSLGLAVFPTLSRRAAVAERAEVERIVTQSLRGVLFLSIPSTIGIIILRRPIVELLFAHGIWNTASTNATAFALGFYALAIPPLAAIEVCTRSFYALKNTWTPVSIAILAAGVDTLLCIGLFHLFGPLQAQGGLGLGTALAVWLQIALLAIALSRRLPGVMGRDFRKAMTAIGLATVIMALCVLGSYELLAHTGPAGTFLHALIDTVIPVIIGAGVYAIAAHYLRLPEVERFIRLARRLPSRTAGAAHR